MSVKLILTGLSLGTTRPFKDKPVFDNGLSKTGNNDMKNNI